MIHGDHPNTAPPIAWQNAVSVKGRAVIMAQCAKTPLLLRLVVVFLALAYLPVVQTGDPLSTGFTVSRAYEAGLIVLALVLTLLFATIRNLPVRIHLLDFSIAGTFILWASLSWFWSVNPALTVSKALQFAVILACAATFTSVFRPWAASHYALANTLTVSLIFVVLAGLVINVIVWGTPLFMSGAEGRRPRFAIGYSHPGYTGDLLCLAIMAIYASSYPAPIRVTGIVGLGFLLTLSDARFATLSLVIALVTMAIARRRRRSQIATVAGLSALGAVYILVASYVWKGDIFRKLVPFLPEDIDTFNGRTRLWNYSIDLIQLNPVGGYGYYASRNLLIPEISWAGNAHNSYLDIALTTGSFGLLLLIAFLFQCVRATKWDQSRLLLGLLIWLTVSGFTSASLFVPTFPTIMLLISLGFAYEMHRKEPDRTWLN